jgi:23S rRNA pseudouridine2605 synthase
MVFKRPRNSRDDNSGRSNNRTSNSDDRSKKTTSSRRSSSAGAGPTGDKRTGKSYGKPDPSEQRSSTSSSRNKSYQSRPDSGDKSASSFTSSERSTFKGKKTPYTGRASDAAPTRSGLSSPRKKPYSGRVSDTDDRPKRAFKDDSAAPKKTFAPRGRSTGGFDSESKPQRGGFSADSRPKREGFKRPMGDKPFNAERPQRSKPTYDKITPDLDAPVKTLRGRKKGAESKDSGLIRLNRYISNAGICSRRKADELISAGVVSVNGVVISELGHKVDPQKDEIRYNGELLKREKMVYVLLNKPKDYITTTEDPHERRTVMHLVEKASKERIYPIGRLDRNTTGLLLMTNDGDLADKLSHPKNSISKLYQVELNKSLTQGDLNKIGFGVELEDGLIKPDSISYVAGGSKREIGIQIHSGKNRIVRRIFESLGYEVVKLDRVVYANLTKKDLPRGRWRYLDESEIIQLKHLI